MAGKAAYEGRFGSIVVGAELPPTPRPYTGLYDYCTKCGACAKRCPVGAISIENGKAHPPCFGVIDASKKRIPGYYGCGKCQTDVPCESRIPRAAYH